MRKRFVFILCVVVQVGLGASTAVAQPGSLSIFADPTGTNCNLTMLPAPAVTSFYIVHVNTSAAAASSFSARKPACLSATWVSDTLVYPVTMGDSQVGVSVGYHSCRAAPIHVLTVNYVAQGLTEPCCYYSVVANPREDPYPAIWVWDCDFNKIVGNGGRGIVNANVTCSCDVSVEDTTWGGIKALYIE